MDRLAAGLDSASQRGLRRALPLSSANTPQIDLSGNDYLALRREPAIAEAVAAAAAAHGSGAGASRVLCTDASPWADLEARFAAWKGVPAALLFPTGYMANLSVLSTLPRAGDAIFLDKFCHASLLDGAFAAQRRGALVRTYPHNDVDRLASLASRFRAETPDATIFIVTDSVFSMDGDTAPLSALAEVRDRCDGVLVLDEAHATGVLGDRGRGLDEAGRADILIATASKALGSLGGIVCGPTTVIDFLVNFARPFLFATAPPPGQVAAIGAALDLIDCQPQRRQRLRVVTGNVREALAQRGWPALGAEGVPIIPLHVQTPERAVSLAAHLRAQGIAAPAIRPPTVAPNTSRVRLSLHAALSDEDAGRVIAAIDQWTAQHGPPRALSDAEG